MILPARLATTGADVAAGETADLAAALGVLVAASLSAAAATAGAGGCVEGVAVLEAFEASDPAAGGAADVLDTAGAAFLDSTAVAGGCKSTAGTSAGCLALERFRCCRLVAALESPAAEVRVGCFAGRLMVLTQLKRLQGAPSEGAAAWL